MRVEELIECGYHPHPPAPSPASGRGGGRGLVLRYFAELLLDGCMKCCDADGLSKRFAVICRLIDCIAILGRFEYEYEYHFIEYE